MSEPTEIFSDCKDKTEVDLRVQLDAARNEIERLERIKLYGKCAYCLAQFEGTTTDGGKAALLAHVATCEKNPIHQVKAWLELACGRIEHMRYIIDNPKSVQAGFGFGETFAWLDENFPKMAAACGYEQCWKTPTPKGPS